MLKSKSTELNTKFNHPEMNTDFKKELISKITNKENVDEIKEILSSNINLLSEPFEYKGDTMMLLHVATMDGQLPLVKFITVDLKCTVDILDQKNQTPLMIAANEGHVEIMKHLLNHNADPTMKSEAFGTPLSYAIYGGYPEAFELLCIENSKRNIKVELHKLEFVDESNALHILSDLPDMSLRDAIGIGYLAKLILNGLDGKGKHKQELIAQKDVYGHVPLFYALVRINKPLVQLLGRVDKLKYSERLNEDEIKALDKHLVKKYGECLEDFVGDLEDIVDYVDYY